MNDRETTKRLFLSIHLPDVVKERIGIFASEIPQLHPHPQDNFHITIKFLGNVRARDQEIVESLMDFLAASLGSFAVEFYNLAVVEGRLRLLVKPSEAIDALYVNVVHNLKKTGLFQADRMEFEPHVTLGLIDSSQLPSQPKAYSQFSFMAETLTLYQTVQGQGLAKFVALKTVTFNKAL